MRDFRSLNVWTKAHRLALAVYEVTRAFPKSEAYGLTAQMRRSAVSIPANIAEGCGRQGDAEFARFLNIAMGSASELQYHVILAGDLGLLESTDGEQLEAHVVEVKRMLAPFIGKLRADHSRRGGRAQR